MRRRFPRDAARNVVCVMAGKVIRSDIESPSGSRLEIRSTAGRAFVTDVSVPRAIVEVSAAASACCGAVLSRSAFAACAAAAAVSRATESAGAAFSLAAGHAAITSAPPITSAERRTAGSILGRVTSMWRRARRAGNMPG